MEQKRILWIVASVGLFLLVVVGFALILYSPTQRQDPVITNNQSTNDIWASPQNATPIDPNYQASVLQGTPLENSVLELWSIFDFIMPGYLFTYKDYV